MNMFSLYFAGSILEQAIGRWRFALLYLVSGIAGSAGALYWSPDAATVGASGAIFGVLGGLLVLERRGNIATGGQVLGLIILNLVITFTFPSISVGGHLGGLIAGAALMFAFVNFRRSWQASVGAAAAIAGWRSLSPTRRSETRAAASGTRPARRASAGRTRTA